MHNAALQVAMTGRTTKASDVYSFGVIMSELCSKVTPWKEVNDDFMHNPHFPSFPPSTPPGYVNLAMR
jgi:serine/threonine protein kinase